MPPKEPWRSDMQDSQESRGRVARDARSARRAADAAVIHGREQWMQAGQPSSGPEQQSMQPGSQRWRKLKELEETVDRRQQLMSLEAEQAEQQRQQFFIAALAAGGDAVGELEALASSTAADAGSAVADSARPCMELASEGDVA